ncbi:MAG: histidine decarboxylase [Armatimonadetes bacterium]|nr:histidine decarboxylase [Armatimonadota bacterium]
MPPLPPEAEARLAAFLGKIEQLTPTFIGYPCSQDYDHTDLAPFLKYSLNNVGDPFADSIYRENTFEFEREVVGFFQRHLRAEEGGTWGYVTAGGTEGNLYGLYLARELFPDGVVYYSEHTHYSVAKIVRVLGARSIMIRGREDGEIDYADLYETLKMRRDVPPIVMANIGSTMHGAVDSLPRIREMLKDLAITRHYIHADAALSGMILPWVDDPQPFGFDAGVDSIAVSGHKFIGAPMPCGVALARRRNVDRVARSVEYVGCMDTTIAGSRNALSPLVLWSAIQRWGEDGLRRRVERSLETADYAIERFADRGIKAWRHRNSCTVVFPRPGGDVINRWQIAPSRDIAHIITMPHVSKAMIDRAVADVADSLE